MPPHNGNTLLCCLNCVASGPTVSWPGCLFGRGSLYSNSATPVIPNKVSVFTCGYAHLTSSLGENSSLCPGTMMYIKGEWEPVYRALHTTEGGGFEREESVVMKEAILHSHTEQPRVPLLAKKVFIKYYNNNNKNPKLLDPHKTCPIKFSFARLSQLLFLDTFVEHYQCCNWCSSKINHRIPDSIWLSHFLSPFLSHKGKEWRGRLRPTQLSSSTETWGSRVAQSPMLPTINLKDTWELWGKLQNTGCLAPTPENWNWISGD